MILRGLWGPALPLAKRLEAVTALVHAVAMASALRRRRLRRVSPTHGDRGPGGEVPGASPHDLVIFAAWAGCLRANRRFFATREAWPVASSPSFASCPRPLDDGKFFYRELSPGNPRCPYEHRSK